MRQGNTFFVDDRYPGYGNFRDYRRRLAAETSAFTRALRCFLRGPEDEENLRVELKGLSGRPELAYVAAGLTAELTSMLARSPDLMFRSWLYR